jgi:hypothetical protein
METVAISLPEGPGKRALAMRVRTASARIGLRIALVTVLAGYPGSTHWHIVSPGKAGTLELTYWPEKTRLWFKIHSGRRAAWMDDAIPALSALLGRA